MEQTPTTSVKLEARAGAWPWTPRDRAVIAVVAIAEVLAVSLAYQHDFVFECRAAAPAWLCAGLSAGVIRAATGLGALAVLLYARLAARRALVLRARLAWPWLAVHVAGFLLVMTPWLYLTDGASPATTAGAFALWIGGLAVGGAGLALALAPAASWRAFATAVGWGGALALGLALAAPEIGAGVQFLWHWPEIAVATFAAAGALLRLVESDVIADPDTVELGVGDFSVLVGPQCSGVEGFALIAGFLAFYCVLFRDVLRFPHALILFPIGLALSWCFNATRIALLILIGAHVSPDLAINGFHSHAGWIMFTGLSLSLAAAAHWSGWFRKPEAAAPAPGPTATPLPPFFEDPVAARILPFAVFMASALLASALAETPTLVYPLRALAMAAALALFWRPLLAMDWRCGWAGPAFGLVVGVIWVATAPPPAADDAALAASVAALPTALLVAWIAARVIGTVALVPLIEEMFFRGYVLGRLNRGGVLWTLVALAVSTGLFAALHDRWLAAALAGVGFALLVLRHRRLSDAVVAHAVANAVIALAAVATGDWHLI